MKKLILIMSLMFLVACQSEPSGPAMQVIERIDKDDYQMLFPFKASPVRNYHGIYLGRTDFMEIGSRLEAKSKEHFSPEEYYLAEGQVLTNALLIQLVRRESTDNPYGLNPPKDSNFLIGTSDISVKDAVVVANVVEINFHIEENNEYPLAGMALAIVLNQNLRTDNGFVTITEQVLYDYGTNMGRKLDRFIRGLTDLENIPLFIAMYVTNPLDAVLPGRFIGSGYFTARGGQFTKDDEVWALLPSTQATSLNAKLAEQFNQIKSDLTIFTPEAVGVIGEARFVNQQVDFLRLTLTLQAKTYTEIKGLAQHTARLIQEIDNRDYPIVVRINSISETLVLMELTLDDELNIIYTY